MFCEKYINLRNILNLQTLFGRMQRLFVMFRQAKYVVGKSFKGLTIFFLNSVACSLFCNTFYNSRSLVYAAPSFHHVSDLFHRHILHYPLHFRCEQYNESSRCLKHGNSLTLAFQGELCFIYIRF